MRATLKALLFPFAVLFVTTALSAQDESDDWRESRLQRWQGQSVDLDYTKALLADTTEESFLTPLVEMLPSSSTVPSPISFSAS